MSNQRAAIYARYSCHEQDGSSTIESQIRACRSHARQHGLTVVEDAVFLDRAREGTTAEIRDAFAAPREPRPHTRSVRGKRGDPSKQLPRKRPDPGGPIDRPIGDPTAPGTQGRSGQ